MIRNVSIALLSAICLTSNLNALDLSVIGGVADSSAENTHVGMGVEIGDYYKNGLSENFHDGWVLGLTTLAGSGSNRIDTGDGIVTYPGRPFFTIYGEYRIMLKLTEQTQAFGAIGLAHNEMADGYSANGYSYGGGLRTFLTPKSYIGAEYKRYNMNVDRPSANPNNWPNDLSIDTYAIFYGIRI